MSCDCEVMGRVALGCKTHETEPDEIIPVCIGCHKEPDEIEEYVTQFECEPDYFDSPADVVRKDDGTYNKDNGHFMCTNCYIKAGQPSSPRGWKAP